MAGRAYSRQPAYFKLADLDPVLVLPADFAGAPRRVKFVPAWCPGLRLEGTTVVVVEPPKRGYANSKMLPVRTMHVVKNEDGVLSGFDAAGWHSASIHHCALPIATGEAYTAANIDCICRCITEAAWKRSPTRTCTVIDTDNGPLVVGPPFRTLIVPVESLSVVGLTDAARKALQVISGTGLDASSCESMLTTLMWSIMAGTARLWLPAWESHSDNEIAQAFESARKTMWEWVPGRFIGPPLAHMTWRTALMEWHAYRATKDEALMKERRRRVNKAKYHEQRRLAVQFMLVNNVALYGKQKMRLKQVKMRKA